MCEEESAKTKKSIMVINSDKEKFAIQEEDNLNTDCEVKTQKSNMIINSDTPCENILILECDKSERVHAKQQVEVEIEKDNKKSLLLEPEILNDVRVRVIKLFRTVSLLPEDASALLEHAIFKRYLNEEKYFSTATRLAFALLVNLFIYDCSVHHYLITH
jgi:hypothetical protein